MYLNESKIKYDVIKLLKSFVFLIFILLTVTINILHFRTD